MPIIPKLTVEHPESRSQLKPCPWCGEIPVYIHDETGVEVHCMFDKCRANPHISTFRGYTKAQISVIWNSYRQHDKPDMEKQKKTVKDLTKFREYISKNQLQSILYDAMCTPDIWEKHLPDKEYMTEPTEPTVKIEGETC